jgi:chromosome segregation ATPase
MKNTHERQKLRDAIEKQRVAEQSLDEAKIARANAQDRWSAANAKIGELEAQIADLEEQAEHSPDALIANLAAGADVDVIDRPQNAVAELRVELQAAEHRSAQWSAAVRTAEEAVEARTKALELAQFYTETAARKVMATEVNATALLCHLESLRVQVLDTQCKLAALANAMTHEAEQRRTIDNALVDDWLRDSPWRDRPAAQSIKDAFARLKTDASALLEV